MQRGRIFTILGLISGTLIVLSLYVFGALMLGILDKIGYVLATSGLLFGVGILVALAVVAIRSNKKSEKESTNEVFNGIQVMDAEKIRLLFNGVNKLNPEQIIALFYGKMGEKQEYKKGKARESPTLD